MFTGWMDDYRRVRRKRTRKGRTGNEEREDGKKSFLQAKWRSRYLHWITLSQTELIMIPLKQKSDREIWVEVYGIHISFFFIHFFILFYVYHMCAWCLRSPDKGDETSETGRTDSC